MLLNPRTSYCAPGAESSTLLLLSGYLAELTVGQRIADQRRRVGIRREKRVTQQELADAIEVSKSTVAAWEGDAQLPAGENLLKLAKALHTTPEYLLHGDSRPDGPSHDDDRAVEWFRDLEQVTRNLEGTAPKGEGKQFKRDQLELIRHMHTDLVGEPVPDWWYMLRGKVDEGEI